MPLGVFSKKSRKENLTMSTKKWVAIAGLGLSVALAGGVAQGAVLSFEDDDVDFILRAPGGVLNPTPVTSGPLLTGDIFVSVFEIPVFTMNGANAIPTGQELTGVAAVQLQNTPTGVPGSPLNFQPVSIGLNAILALGTDPDPMVVNGGAGGGSTIAMWFNGTVGTGGDINLELNRSVNAATNCPNLAFCIEQASLGQLVQVDGFGAANNFWTATTILAGGNDIGVVLGTNNNALVAGFNAAQTSFFSLFGPVGGIDFTTGLPCATPGTGTCVQFSLSGTITGGQGLSNGAIAHSDFDGQKLTLVPEPGVLTLLGAALLAFGFARRERKA
jgi:hypothetical protein